MGAPYIPTRSLLGTGLLRVESDLQGRGGPVLPDPVVLVPALTPDVAILHVQRADAEGHAHCWGTLGVTREAALAARRVVIVAEEIRSRECMLSDPGLVLVPPFKVAAVVHEPFGAFPSPVQGDYRRDHDFYHRYHDETRTRGRHAPLARRLDHGRRRLEGLSRPLGPEARSRCASRPRGSPNRSTLEPDAPDDGLETPNETPQ